MEVNQMLRIPSKWIVRGILIGGLILVIASGCIVGGMLIVARQQAAANMGTPLDPNIKFIGRWDISNSAIYNSYWPGAYFETSFTGTSIKIRMPGFSGIHISIDHGPDHIYYAGSGAIVNPTRVPLKAGTHTVRVAVANDTDTLHFKGLILDPGARTVAPAISSRLIEFIGDSITVGATDTNYALSDYAWLTSERMSVEHTQIAQGGMCVVDNVQCGTPNTIGMSRQYFKLQTSYFSDSPNWDFSRYQATAVVINLGTNDQGNHVSNALFQSTYISFLHNIRAKYPHALIFAMEPFNGADATFIQVAVQALNAAGDHNVRYIDTTGWLQSGSGDYSVDGLHPSDTGQVKAANRLEPILAAALRTA
jgi:lysophospholipase L1-like esterase